MAMVSRGLVNQQQLSSDIELARKKLGPEVVDLASSLGADSVGEPAIFFVVTLADAAVTEEMLTDLTDRITTTLLREVQPIENWGLHPYFNFRSQGERAGAR